MKQIIPSGLAFVLLLATGNCFAYFKDHYIGIEYSGNSANGLVTNDLSGIALTYQKDIESIEIFPTRMPYMWYLDIATGVRYFELEDPILYLGIPNTQSNTVDMQATSYFLEIGLLRRQELNSFMNWLLGSKVGGFLLFASPLDGITSTSQVYKIESSSTPGLTVSAYTGISLMLSKHYEINTILQIRKYYLGEFDIKEKYSSLIFKYPDFTSIGFGVGISRSF